MAFLGSQNPPGYPSKQPANDEGQREEQRDTDQQADVFKHDDYPSSTETREPRRLSASRTTSLSN